MKILISDVENCPVVLKDLQSLFNNYDKVIICYSECKTKISFSSLHSCINAYISGQLQIVHIKKNKKKKNSADHAISFVAGNILKDVGEKSHFDIYSGDADLDNTVEMLKSYGYSAKRIYESQDTLISLEMSKQVNSFINKHLKQGSRPRSVESLENVIKHYFKFGENLIKTNKIISILSERSIVKIKDGMVEYNDSSLGLRKNKKRTNDTKQIAI